MKCSRCQHENPAAARFCNACGAPMEQACALSPLVLVLVCASCGFTNDPGDEVCGGCAQSLALVPRKIDASGDVESRPFFILPIDGEGKLDIDGQVGDLRLRLLTTTYLERAHHYHGEDMRYWLQEAETAAKSRPKT